MLLILTLLLFFFFFPLTAWAYFDPGFGGYLVNSVTTMIATGLAFMSAALIYFFRTIIGQKLCLIILLSVLGIGSFFLGAFLHHTFYKRSADHPSFSGPRVIDAQHMFEGYNLNYGKLFDENGRIVKHWSNHFLGIIDKNGDYYAQKNGDNHAQKNWGEPPWGRYTWDDRVIWEKHFPIHHELYLAPTGTIFTFTRETHRYNNFNVDFDIILEFDKNGRELQRFSFWDHLKEFQPYHDKFLIDADFPVIFHPFLFLWEKIFHQDTFDYFHINSFFMVPPNPLEGKDPAFRPGNWLISIFHGSMVLILDQDTKKVLWHAVGNEVQGGLEGQHAVSMLPDGNILLFENGDKRKASRILVIDPLTLKIKWQYSNTNFFSEAEGFVQALPNGNFLVTESKKGHVFELAPDKRIVWEYYDTTIKDDDIYRMTRYPKIMIDHLLQKDGAP